MNVAMDSSSRPLAALAVVAAAIAIGARTQGVAVSGPPDLPPISADARAAGLRFATGVAERDRAWILDSIARARPEARALIGEVDGMIEVTTHRGDPLGVTESVVSARGARFTIALDVASLDGKRVADRDVVVLHELGHAVDAALVDKPLDERLDAGIPRTGQCVVYEEGLSGSCTEPAERFADTFAKWALRGRVSAVGAGYGVAGPPSLETWGAPLAALANEVSVRS
jgi:hypothetical protein